MEVHLTLAGHLGRSLGASWGVSMETESLESVEAARGARMCVGDEQGCCGWHG